MQSEIRIRLAVPADIPKLQELIRLSVLELQAGDYTREQMLGALKTVFGVDSQLIADGTYLVAEAVSVGASGGGGMTVESGNTPVKLTRKTREQSPDPVGINSRTPTTGGDGALPGSEVVIAGCGGWSKRKTLYGADQWSGREDTLLDPKRDAAKIRAFFVHPAWARRGVGTLILEACENAARAAGFTRFEMGATLTGAKLFGAKGYEVVRPMEVPLEGGGVLPILHMEKRG
jgi:hypothetical protein